MKIFNFGNRISNQYIIQLENGYLLIDTGYLEQFERLCNKMRKMNMAINDIKYILLTHAHDDHAGFLNELLDRTDAKVILHPQAVSRLLKGQNSFDGGCTSYLALLFCKIMKWFGKGEHLFQPVDRKDRYIILDETTQTDIEKAISGKIIALPGHTGDSIGLLLPDGTLFCGDAAMNGFPSTNRTIIWVENKEDFKRSWETMLQCHAEKIYPSHGKPFASNDLGKYIHKLDSMKLFPLSPKTN